MIITALMTRNGAPYTGYTPVISIWNAASGAQIITDATMYQIGTSSFFGYNFSTYVFGAAYVYTITGDPSVDTSERYQYGSLEQDLPDRVIGSVVSDVGNTETTFIIDRTENADNYWKDAIILMLTGSLANQVKKIYSYNGATKAVTLSSALTGIPSGGDRYLLLNA